MSKQKRNKKYNPQRNNNPVLSMARLTPLLSPLDTLATLLKRGYLTNDAMRCNEDTLPAQYVALSFVYQHTFLISSIKSAQDDPIVKYVKNIRSVIEKMIIKILHHSTTQDGMTVVPDKVEFGKIGLGKVIWFIENSKKALYGIRVQDYLNAVKDGSSSHMLKLQLDKDCPVRHFVDMDSSSKFLKEIIG